MEKNDVAGIIDNLIIIPDTNILLYLYKWSFNASKNIVDLLNKVKDKVIIPSRVYKEYMAHKDEEQAKIDRKYDNFTKNLKKQVSELKGKLGKNISEGRKYEFPDCDVLEAGINTFLDKTVQAITTYGNSLSSEKQNKNAQQANVEQIIQFWRDNEKIMTDITIIRLLEYIKEGEFRFRYKMPPGYMDEAEKDKDKEREQGKSKETKKNTQADGFEARIRKFGDLFIWKEILEIGKNLTGGEKIIFLTNDVKEDWWTLRGEQDNKIPVCMREELKQEYVATTGSDKIEFLTLSKFYELFSDYYKICDIKTTLELEYEAYVRGLIYGKYREEIEEKIYERVGEIDWEDVNPDFYNIEVPDVVIYGFDISEIILHYDDDGETAIYDVRLATDPFLAEISRSEGERHFWLGDVEVIGNLVIQIQRDLRNLDEDGLSIEDFSYDILSCRDAWDVLREREQDERDARAEMADALEEYYMH